MFEAVFEAEAVEELKVEEASPAFDLRESFELQLLDDCQLMPGNRTSKVTRCFEIEAYAKVGHCWE